MFYLQNAIIFKRLKQMVSFFFFVDIITVKARFPKRNISKRIVQNRKKKHFNYNTSLCSSMVDVGIFLTKRIYSRI